MEQDNEATQAVRNAAEWAMIHSSRTDLLITGSPV